MRDQFLKVASTVWRLAFGFSVAGLGQATFAASCWTDADLLALEKSNANAVVYVWSPRMALSVLHADEVVRQARMAGLLFVPVVDARVPDDEWQSALSAAAAQSTNVQNGPNDLRASRGLCASRLINSDAYQHFPSVFMVHSGHLQQGKFTGAMNASFWADAFRTGLARQTIVNPASPASPVKVSALEQAIEKMPVLDSVSEITAKSGESTAVGAESGCVAKNQFIALPPELAGRGDDQSVALGAYERISPDGRFVLRSFSGKNLSTVSLIELPGPSVSSQQADKTVVAITQTPLSNEAFPVQGSWRYVVDTNGQHYTFRDLLTRQKQAAPHFQGGMSGFYAAAAEVASTYPSKSVGPIKIRSLSWPNADGDSETVGEGMLTTKTITVDSVQNRLLADSGRSNLCLSRINVDGSLYSLPMISLDGQYFSALPQRPTDNVSLMRVFGFGADGKQCLPAQQFASSSGKVTFGFKPDSSHPSSNELADLVYEYRGQAWWYASKFAKAFNLAPWEERAVGATTAYRQKIVASAFPGVTRDGRVIYAATWQQCTGSACVAQAGYVVSDPYQSNAFQEHLSKLTSSSAAEKKAISCIKTGDVLKERSHFANFHNISLR